MKDWSPLVVGIGGTLRDGSTSERALRLALTEAARLGAKTQIFAGQSLNLPHYDSIERTERATSLVEALRTADGVIIATPSYHGSISGLVKNAIDYTEDLRGDARSYLAGRAVGAIVCAGGAQAMGATLGTLRTIVHALRGWPTPFSAVINTAQRPFSADGACSDPVIAQQLTFVAEQVVEFARMRRLYESRRNGLAPQEISEAARAQCA